MNGSAKLFFFSVVSLVITAGIGLGFYQIMGGAAPRRFTAAELFVYLLLGAQFLLAFTGLVVANVKMNRARQK